MNQINRAMIHTNTFRQSLLCGFLLAGASAGAQNSVVVTPVITPPYSTYLYAYQDQLLVNISNTTGQNLSVKIIGSIEGDNGYAVSTKEIYMPPQPIVLGAYETRILQGGNSLLNFLDPPNVTITAPQSIRNMVAQTGQLPEGNYSLCVRAVEYTTGTPLSDEAPAGCLYFPISSVQPPLITAPLCEDSLTTEWPAFTWTPPIGMLGAADIRYDLYVVKLLPGQNAVEAVGQAIDYHANNPVIRQGLMAPSYVWQSSDPVLDVNAWYAVAVVAKDLGNILLIENQGRSEACTFFLKKMPGNGVPTAGFSPNVLLTLPDSTMPIANARLRGRLLYTFKAPPSVSMTDQITPIMTFPAPAAPMNVDMPGSNAASISSSGTVGNLQLYQGLGGSISGTSWLQGNSMFNQSQGMFNVGTLFDLFPHEKWQDPYPVSSSTAKPLKNMPVRLVERTVLEGVRYTGPNGQLLAQQDVVVVGLDEPEAMQDLLLTSDPLTTETLMDSLLGHKGGSIVSGRILATFNTDADGRFTVDYHQLEPSAFQAINPALNAMRMGVDIEIQGGYVQHVPKLSFEGTVQADRAYRVLMLEVASPYYCSPDLRILAQPGDDLQLPDATAYVRSYRLRVHVQSDASANQTMVNQPLPNMQVTVSRADDQHPEAIPENEGKPSGNGAAGQLPGAKLVAQGITNAQGEAVIPQLVNHRKYTPDEYAVAVATNPVEGSLAYLGQVKQYCNGCGNGPEVEFGWAAASAGEFSEQTLLNSRFKEQEYSLGFTVAPQSPRVIGRVMASSTEAVPGARVELSLTYKNEGSDADASTMTKVVYTDPKGYFQFSSLPVYVSNGKFLGPYAVLKIDKPGFKQAVRPAVGKQQMLYGFQWDHTAGILLSPLGRVTGTVVDEDGQAVKSDIKCGDAPTTRTETVFTYQDGASMPGAGGQNNFSLIVPSLSETFDAPSPSGNAVPILVEPLSDKYFPATFTKAIGDNASQSIGTLVVKEKQHRVRIKVRDAGNAAIAGAVVTLGDLTATTQADGSASFRFASKGLEFRLKVRAQGEYTPLDTLVINEVTPEYTDLVVHLRTGARLAGRVQEMYTGTPLADARVWVELGSDAYGPILLETFTGTDGHFELHGVPLDAQQVHAAKSSPGGSWVGDTKPLIQDNLWNPLGGHLVYFQQVTLELQAIQGFDLDSLLGFPIELEQFEDHADGTATIGGAFVRVPGNGNFTLAEPHTRLPFSQVAVKRGPANAQGVPMAVPVGTAVWTDATQVALKMYGNHDMTLEGVGLLGRISVEPANGTGVIKGLVSTELSTFRFTYDFNGRFYLGDGPDEFNIPVFRSGGPMPLRTYNLMDLGHQQSGQFWLLVPQPKDIAFNLRGFEAHADRGLSYVNPDTFSLHTVLRIHDIPQMSPNELSIYAGDVKVMNQDIIGLQGGGNTLSLKIGNWQLTGTAPWSFDKDLGCIKVPTAKLNTGKTTADVHNMLLWPNDIDLDASSLGEVRIGGLFPLKETGNSPWEFGYSQAEDAWVLGKMANSAVMYFQGVPKLVPDRVDLSVFRMRSNGNDKLGVVESDHVLEGIMNFHLNGIEAGTDNVQLLGIPWFAIPNFPADQSARVLVSRTGDQTTSKLMPLSVTVPTIGNVEYTFTDGEVLSPGKFETNGRWLVWDEYHAKFFKLIGHLTHTASGTHIDVIKTNGGEMPGNMDQVVALAGGQGMVVRGGQQSTTGNQWQNLWYTANLGNCKAINEAQAPLRFEADGAVHLTEGSIAMDQIDTPFGNMVLTYDFAKSMLVGSLTMQHFPTGPLTVNQATVGLIAGGGGFAAYCSDADVSINILPPPINSLQPGFVIGAHTALPDEVVNGVMSHARNKSLPPQLAQNRVNGLFVTAKKPILETELPGFDLSVSGIGVSVGGHMNTGIDTRYWLDLEEGLHVGGLAYFDLEYGADVTVCSLCLSLLMELSMESEVSASGTFDATACGVASISGSLCGVGVSESTSVKAVLSSSDGLSVGLGSGTSCSQQNVPDCN